MLWLSNLFISNIFMPRNTPTFLLLICTAVIALLAGFLFSSNIDLSKNNLLTTNQRNENADDDGQPLGYNGLSTSLPGADQQPFKWRDQITQRIDQLMLANRWNDAVSVIDNAYQQADAQELELFKQQVITRATHLADNHNDAHASALLEAYANAFNDVDAWRELGASATRLSNWDAAVDAYLNASRLEYQPEAFASLMQAVIRSAAHVRASLEQQGDQLGVLHLYQQLYDQHPDYARFQLELAQSFLRLGDDVSAIPLLEMLQYDAELGALGKQKLATVEQRLESLAIARQQGEIAERPIDTHRQPDIVVPLIRSGNSFVLDVNLNSRSVRMLLDTGASITALSSHLISRLNLKPTGRYIKLTTANGVRRSQLFQSDSLRIGTFAIKNLVVAEVDLSRNHGVQGLLGTDVLNKIDPQFSYIIDNQSNSLIFRRK